MNGWSFGYVVAENVASFWLAYILVTRWFHCCGVILCPKYKYNNAGVFAIGKVIADLYEVK